LRATFELMNAPADKLSTRAGYNLTGMSFSPAEQALAIKKYMPDFSISYEPDFRQAIADSWPQSINDTEAREHWGWKPEFDLDAMTEVMLKNIKA